ncbi:hypothetical protein [Paracidovorax wautersii]|uniref:Uncharacterized protein n=1 Tax=Paracidovorax wautersii TaxID=1177982 RepID=A0A1I2GBW1_9BURK|nr:hypothetical protein [Paracidovorax wautersii]SFF15002.1 hypothetical protein SAMN04489711_11480 [Paracidovorax wautersii]
MNDPLLYEDELDAARDAVKHLGGAKKVGPMIWPDKTPDGAARYLLDCLNCQRAERLAPSQLMMLMRLSREVGFHGLTAFIMRETGYAPPVPVEPTSEAELLTRRMQSMVGEFAALTQRLERIQKVQG